jgi:dienelactone hydrolase
MHRKLTAGLLILLCFESAAVFAQLTTPERFLNAASQAKDLEFPTEPSGFSFFSSPRFALYKPEGTGPFPAIVLHHQCGGLRNASGSWQNMSMLGWAKEAVGRGYVALVLDSLGPRGVDTVCMGAKGGVNFARGLKDALQAAEHLRKLSFVDRNRVAFAGYSWGAGVGLLASSKKAVGWLNQAERFNAVVSFYPPCYIVPPNRTPPYELVLTEIDRPLLVLMAERDNETPPEECVSRLAPQRTAGAPIEWHVYPEATHCWDCENLDGFRKTNARGTAVTYRYDKNATKDSAQRMFTFIEKAFVSRP